MLGAKRAASWTCGRIRGPQTATAKNLGPKSRRILGLEEAFPFALDILFGRFVPFGILGNVVLVRVMDTIGWGEMFLLLILPHFENTVWVLALGVDGDVW